MLILVARLLSLTLSSVTLQYAFEQRKHLLGAGEVITHRCHEQNKTKLDSESNELATKSSLLQAVANFLFCLFSLSPISTTSMNGEHLTRARIGKVAKMASPQRASRVTPERLTSLASKDL